MAKGGALSGDYAGSNRYEHITLPHLAILQHGWRAQATQVSWHRILSLLPADQAEAAVGPAQMEVQEEPPEPAFELVAVGPVISGWATHYGEAFAGGVLGCGTGYYTSENPDIVAVGPARYAQWPCGTQLEICGPAGCIVGTRHDACPGCTAYVFDLSEAGSELVCGSPPHTCRVTVQQVRFVPVAAEPNALAAGR